jgi:hypothetical protein
LFLAVLIVCVFAQTQVDRIKIDDYEEGTNNIVIVLNATLSSGSTPISSVSIFTSTSGPSDTRILGGERDLQYTAQIGAAGRVFSTSVSTVNGSGQWEISTPNGASGVVLMQYDSTDASIVLDVDGFTKITGTPGVGVDLTDGGLGESFHTVIETDIATTYFIFVYSPDGSQCSNSIQVPAGNVPIDSILLFSSFSGTCDFESVGAIEVQVQAFQNVDTIVTLFATQGDPDPSTPSLSATPSISNSPSRGASLSPSPSATPSPSIALKECFCQCPAFTCELIFDVDDDDNHALFFVDDDGFGKSRGYFGGYGYYYANGQGQSNGAASLAASIAAVLAGFLAFF